MRENKILLVIWEDADKVEGERDVDWIRNNLKANTTFYTVGLLIRKGKRSTTLIGEISSRGTGRDTVIIPNSLIKEVRCLGKLQT